MIIRKDTAFRMPIRLLDINGLPVTGMLPANFNDGSTQGDVVVIKADSTIATISLVDSTNFFEIDATAAPGLYHILVPASHTDVVGTLQLSVLPDSNEFLSSIITAQVDNVLLDAEQAVKILRNKLQIFTAGPDANRMVVFDNDGTTPLLKWDLTDSGGAPTTTNPYTRTPV